MILFLVVAWLLFCLGLYWALRLVFGALRLLFWVSATIDAGLSGEATFATTGLISAIIVGLTWWRMGG